MDLTTIITAVIVFLIFGLLIYKLMNKSKVKILPEEKSIKVEVETESQEEIRTFSSKTVFIFKGTGECPRIEMNPEQGIFEISGRSMPENFVDFYKPLITWLKNYKVISTFEFVFKLEYCNTSSLKCIF